MGEAAVQEGGVDLLHGLSHEVFPKACGGGDSATWSGAGLSDGAATGLGAGFASKLYTV